MKRIFGVLAIIVASTNCSAAQTASPEARKKFFKEVTEAKFFDGSEFNCCGPGDATKARVIASRDGVLAVEILDPMRHPTAKAGEIVSVPARKIVKWPRSPVGMGTILFLGTSKNPVERVPFCLVQKRAGG